MTGYATYLHCQRVAEQANKLGFRLGHPKHGHWSNDLDQVTLYPAEKALPIYSRDADIFTGTFREVEIFLAGWSTAQQYDAMLSMTTDKRRKQYEDRELARRAEQRKRKEQAEMLKVLRATDAENAGKKK